MNRIRELGAQIASVKQSIDEVSGSLNSMRNMQILFEANSLKEMDIVLHKKHKDHLKKTEPFFALHLKSLMLQNEQLISKLTEMNQVLSRMLHNELNTVIS